MRTLLIGLWGVLFISSPVAAQADQSTGLIFLDESSYRSVPLASTPLLGDLPASVDWSYLFPDPSNQGRQGSCVGWAIANLKTYQEKIERNWDLSDDNHVFSPSYIYNQIKQGPNCGGGSSFVDALNIIRREGIASIESFPYDDRECSSVPSTAVRQSARPFAVADWRRVNALDDTEIRTQVASGFPVLIGVIVDEEFGRLKGKLVYNQTGGISRGGHAMVIVGYSDNKKAVKVINSWGTEWGDGGFGWIGYDILKKIIREAYVVQDVVVNTPRPSPPPEGRPSERRPPERKPLPDASVSLGMPSYQHNFQITTPNGIFPGLRIVAPGVVLNGSGRYARIVARFNYLNGQPLVANPQESKFRDVSGLVATSTAQTAIGSDNEDITRLEMYIPYFALNFQPSNYTTTYNLSFSVDVYIDNRLQAQSMPIGFQMQW